MRVVAALLSCVIAGTAWADDIRVLSVVEPGLVKIAEQFRRETGNRVRLQFGTAPQLERRLSGDPVDVLICAPGLMNDQLRRGKIEVDGHTIIGRVGVGVVVRLGAPEPDIGNLERLKQSLLGADSIVYNPASAPGLYLEKLFDLLGIGEQLKPKTVRYATGAQVFEHVIGGKGNEIGFGAINEIKPFESKGLKLVGPLPEQVQNSTAYAGGVVTEAPSTDVAREFVRYLGTPFAKATFAAAGIE